MFVCLKHVPPPTRTSDDEIPTDHRVTRPQRSSNALLHFPMIVKSTPLHMETESSQSASPSVSELSVSTARAVNRGSLSEAARESRAVDQREASRRQ